MKFSIVLIFMISGALMANGVGAQRIKNNPVLILSSTLVSAGKKLRDLMWQRADGMASGLAGKDQVEAAEDGIDELAELTDGTFSGIIETTAQTNILKAEASTEGGLQDMGSPPPKSRTSSSSNSESVDSQEAARALFGSDDDSEVSRNLFGSGLQKPMSTPKSSSNSNGYKTPQRSRSPSTSRSSSTTSEASLTGPLKTLHDLVLRARSITEGASQIEQMGLFPLLLHKKHWIEATNPAHPFVGSNQAAGAFNVWKEEPNSHNFLSSQGVHSFVKNVYYLDANERAQVRISADSQGNVLNSQDQPLQNFAGMIVVGPDGLAYAMRGEEGSWHHSSFFAGGALIWAGEIRINSDGQITELTDESGHYQPTAVHNIQGLNVLRNSGFNLSQAKFTQTFRQGCGFNSLERSLSIDDYLKLTVQEIAKSSASQAQSVVGAAATASPQTQNETAT